MTEPTKTEQGIADNGANVKTVNDLKFEELQKSIEDMKAQYESSLKEMQKVNEELWAKLHPVKPSASEPTNGPPIRPQPTVVDTVYDKVLEKMGIKME